MSWSDFAAARQVLAEERIGSAIRSAQRAEEAQIQATKAAIRKSMPKPLPDLAADAQTIAERARSRTIQPKPITDEIIG